MRLVIALSLLAAGLGAPAAAQPGRGGIPPQFHGRWAEDAQACRARQFSSVITINARGWSSYEEGGDLLRVGQVRRTTHYFRVRNSAGNSENEGSLALRRNGTGIVMTFHEDGGAPTTYTMIRCR